MVSSALTQPRRLSDAFFGKNGHFLKQNPSSMALLIINWGTSAQLQNAKRQERLKCHRKEKFPAFLPFMDKLSGIDRRSRTYIQSLARDCTTAQNTGLILVPVIKNASLPGRDTHFARP